MKDQGVSEVVATPFHLNIFISCYNLPEQAKNIFYLLD